MNVYATRRSASWPAPVLAEVRRQAPLRAHRRRPPARRRQERGAVPDHHRPAADDVEPHAALARRLGEARVRLGAGDQRRALLHGAPRSTPWPSTSRATWPSRAPNRLFNRIGIFLAPPNIEGQLTLVWEPVDPLAESRSVWTFEPLLRRVRRVPSLDHDDLDPRTQGLRTADQYDGWNGSPDLYDWKLLGKREMYIPYNSYKLADKKLKYADILKPGYVDAELLRYELHRVWVIEATLAPRASHRYPKRIFYLDEDTWQVALEDIYDAGGALWRFGDHPALQFYDVQVPWYAATIHYDFKADAYLASFLSNEETLRLDLGLEGRDQRLPARQPAPAGHTLRHGHALALALPASRQRLHERRAAWPQAWRLRAGVRLRLRRQRRHSRRLEQHHRRRRGDARRQSRPTVRRRHQRQPVPRRKGCGQLRRRRQPELSQRRCHDRAAGAAVRFRTALPQPVRRVRARARLVRHAAREPWRAARPHAQRLRARARSWTTAASSPRTSSAASSCSTAMSTATSTSATPADRAPGQADHQLGREPALPRPEHLQPVELCGAGPARRAPGRRADSGEPRLRQPDHARGPQPGRLLCAGLDALEPSFVRHLRRPGRHAARPSVLRADDRAALPTGPRSGSPVSSQAARIRNRASRGNTAWRRATSSSRCAPSSAPTVCASTARTRSSASFPPSRAIRCCRRSRRNTSRACRAWP